MFIFAGLLCPQNGYTTILQFSHCIWSCTSALHVGSIAGIPCKSEILWIFWNLTILETFLVLMVQHMMPPYPAIYPHGGVYAHPGVPLVIFITFTPKFCLSVLACTLCWSHFCMMQAGNPNPTPMPTDSPAKSSANSDRRLIKKLKGIDSLTMSIGNNNEISNR